MQQSPFRHPRDLYVETASLLTTVNINIESGSHFLGARHLPVASNGLVRDLTSLSSLDTPNDRL